jgi:A/G-specific adenine glycosylase
MKSPLHRKLMDWYDSAKRDLPWRGTRDPYAIWVSEVMLQQTQVATVLPYYERWMRRFPTVEALAAADEQEVLSLWQGLGYYRRCRLLHKGAQFVASHGMPATCAGWMKVPGVGRYTAGPISSIAFGEIAPLVDGNVQRVYARLTADDKAGKDVEAAAWTWAARNMLEERPGDWNQALMELGACICKPAAPDCEKCPLANECAAHRQGMQQILPTKMKGPEIVSLQETVWIPVYRGEFGLRQIPEGEWWQGMWQFPCLAADGDEAVLRACVGDGHVQHTGALTYHVTHHRIRLQVYLHRSVAKAASLTWVAAQDLASLPMPSPQRKALKLAMNLLEAPALKLEEAGSR